MESLIRFTGLAAAVLGALVCLVAGITRFLGHFYLAGFEATTLFMAGMGLMIFACTLKLYR